MLEPAKTVSIFQNLSEPRTFAGGEVIFSEGQTGEEVYGILEGEIEMLVDGKL